MGARVLGARAALGAPREPDLDVVRALAAFAALLIDPVAGHEVKELSPLAAVLAALAGLPVNGGGPGSLAAA